jgi:hypothetical protein
MKHIYLRVEPDGRGVNGEDEEVPYIRMTTDRFSKYGITLGISKDLLVGMEHKPDYSPRSIVDAWWMQHRDELRGQDDYTSSQVVGISHLLYFEEPGGSYYAVIGVTGEAFDGRMSVMIGGPVEDGDAVILSCPRDTAVNLLDESGFIIGYAEYDEEIKQWIARK